MVEVGIFNVDPPLYPPPLSTPAGAERGANSRIWSCFLTEDVQDHGQRKCWRCVHASQCVQGHVQRGCWGRTHARVLTAVNSAQAPKIPQTNLRPNRPQVSTACTPCQKTRAQIWLLSPPFRPGGGGKGLGDRGGSTIKNTVLAPGEATSIQTDATNRRAVNAYLKGARGKKCL
jgi:hypothetical protein